jgi:hypothetical protein
MFKKEIWEIIPGLKIEGKPAPYGVLNERSVRATAGIMFAIWFFTMLTTFYTKDYILLTFVVIGFFIDFFIKVFFWPKYSPLSFFGKLLVKNQKPEYVWAIQKRFAWTLWLIMSGSVILLAIIFEIRGILPLALCSICLIFMWLESSVWVCVGCNIYSFLLKKWIMKQPEIKPACPGWVCSLK